MFPFAYSPWGGQPLEVETFGDLSRYAPPEVSTGWPRVVAFSGVAGSGKSTAGSIMRAQGYTLLKFAGPLKAMCRAIGLTDEHIEGSLKEVPCDVLGGKTPRHIMQTLGTEWGRGCVGENFWVDIWRRDAERVLAAGGNVVVDDCRFANEAHGVRCLAGAVFRLEGRGGLAGHHASEQFDFTADAVIENTGSVEELSATLALVLDRWV